MRMRLLLGHDRLNRHEVGLVVALPPYISDGEKCKALKMLKIGILLFMSISLGIVTAAGERISVKKCKEYNSLYRELYVDPIFPDVKEYGKLECPVFTSGGTILGGRDAEPFEFPAMVSLMYPDNSGKLISKCGGVLISEQFVMSAAHCFKYQKPEKIVLGEINLAASKHGRKRIDMDIAEIIQHENYSPGSGHSDIALLKLAKALVLKHGLKEPIRPVCLQQRELPQIVNFSATGFGKTDTFGDAATILQTVNLPRVDQAECSNFYRDALDFDQRFPGVAETERDSWVLSESVLCAGGTAGKDTCQGDSGGPLFYSPDKKYPCHRRVVGITSFGSAYCGTRTPGVYTKVSAYIDWIEKHVWPNN